MNRIIPPIGIGTFLLEGTDAYGSVITALETGYRLIDTAAVYNNEKEVGKAITDSKIRKYEELLDTWRGFEYLYEQGLCKAIGVCNITLFYLDKLMKDAKIPPMFCQIELHPFLQQEIFIEYCQQHKIKVIGYGLFAKGHVFQNDKLQQLAMKNNTTVANLVLSWAQMQGVIPLVKSKNEERIKSNFLNNIEISAELLSDIRILNDGIRVYRDPENNPYV